MEDMAECAPVPYVHLNPNPPKKKKMIRNKILYCLFLVLITASSCSSQPANVIFPEKDLTIPIHRFDQALLQLIETNDTSLEQTLLADYPAMLDIVGKGVLNLQSPQIPGFFDRIINYYSEPTLKSLYKDAVNAYQNTSDIEAQLGHGFAFLKANFPSMQVPAVYMHVSGFSQNVLAGDSLLSLSIDRYLGTDYPLYLQFFRDYQRIKMQRQLVAADYLAGWLMSEFPFSGNENVLLERMVYEGKIKYIVSLALPELSQSLLMGYTDTAGKWCNDHAATLWSTIIQRKHLYTPDRLTTAKYFSDAPCTFLSDETPGNIGTWIGWQIIKGYMQETQSSLSALMQQNNAQEILTLSKYKGDASK